MSLATRERTAANGMALATRRAAVETGALSIEEVWYMAERAAASKMFGGIDTPDKAFTLMILCQSEGLHPIQALKRYDIIQGRPAMKAAAIQAEFQARGGLIEVIETTATVARARFSHATKQPTPIELTARLEDYRHLAGKDNWKHYPSDMLWARLVARGVRRIDPGVVTGIGSVEEAWDTVAAEEAARRPQVEPTNHAGQLPPRGADVPLPGAPNGIDGRPFIEVVQSVADATGKGLAEALAHLRNKGVQSGHLTGDVPTKRSRIVESLTALYRTERDWLRTELAEFARPEEPALPPQPSSVYSEADEPGVGPAQEETSEADSEWAEGRE